VQVASFEVAVKVDAKQPVVGARFGADLSVEGCKGFEPELNT
jgi:hypothetical protein